jgi:subtilisin family serine protease
VEVNRTHLRSSRARVGAALLTLAVVWATVTSIGDAVGAAPAAASGQAKAVPVKLQSLKGKKGDPPISGRGPARRAGEPSRSAAQPPLPRSGRYGFLLQLATPSTMSAYNSAAGRGRKAATAAAKAQYKRVKADQARVHAALPRGSRELFRTHGVLAGLAVYTDVHNYAALRAISGVRAVFPIAPKTVSNSYAVPLVRAPQAWTAHGDLGQDSTVAVIDTGIDYTHANFGGPGTKAAYNAARASDAAAANPAQFPSDKIIGGYDLAGDAYDASNPSSQPQPDPNPLDCAGHGSHVSGTVAGDGENADGTTYTGAYDTSTPFSTMRIGPGMAPKAKLYAYKVFGCAGSTSLVTQAIDMAADPNGDGDTSDHADVINMSLGSDFGSPQDGDSVASNLATDLGITVVVASGNGSDLYDVGGAPGDAVKVIAVANTVDAYSQIDTVQVSAPAGIAGGYGAARSIAYDWATKPDLSGVLAAPSDPANKTGCASFSSADRALLTGKIAFLEWHQDLVPASECGSAARAANVVAAGGTGFVFANDAETFSTGITGSAVIPGVLVTKSAGDAMRAQLANGVTISGTTAGTFRQLIPADNDKVNDSSSRGIRGAGNIKPDVAAVGTSVFSTAMGTGNEGVSFTGTSMATPMVAGLAALVRSKHPDWTPQEVKADIMNTAGQDLFTGDNHTGATYPPNRVGAGRIKADDALDNQVVAYVTNDPGAVSVSFGPVAVTGPTTLTKTVKVVNKGLSAATFNLSYDPITTVPGVTYSVSPSSVTVGRRSAATFTVTFSVTDPTTLTKTVDPTVATQQDGVAREFLADASGRVVLSPTDSRPTLRVPVYSAPRPASRMTQPASLTTPPGSVQLATLPLTGTGVGQGSGATRIDSLVSGFELQATSGRAPQCGESVTTGCVHYPDERSADLRYVGATTDAPLVRQAGHDPYSTGFAYFAINTYGPWRTPASTQEFDILIDTNGDSAPDAVLYNTRLTGTDVFVSQLVDPDSGDVLDVEEINQRLGDVDTALFDSDVLVMPVALSALPGVSAAHPRIRYGVVSFSGEGADPVDLIGMTANGVLANPLTIDTARPGVVVYGSGVGPLYFDQPNSALVVRRDAAAYGVDHAKGALMVHFHNRVGSKAQVLALRSAAQVHLKLSATTARYGTPVTATVTVANTGGPVPTGSVQVVRSPGVVLVRGPLSNGKATLRLPSLGRGGYTVYAKYDGDGSYLAGASGTVRLTIT